MNPDFIRDRVKRWELLRVAFNVVCAVGAWVGWGISNEFTIAIDESPPAHLSDPGALRDLLLGFAVLNVAYTLIYAVEFVALARTDQSWNRGAKVILFCVGCVLGFAIAARGASSISSGIATEKRHQMLMNHNSKR
jgi:hypothetical protein